MKKSFKHVLSGIVLFGTLSACAPTAQQLTTLLEDNPEILVKAIEKNPDSFMAAVQKAAQSAQSKTQQNAAKSEEQKFEEEFKNPLKPDLANKKAMGDASAKITIVEYTDFQCPYCARGYKTLEEVRAMYGSKVRVIVKNLPLPMHPLAMPAAQRFEALLMQNTAKGYAFYHEIFKNQGKLSGGEKYLDAAAKKVGADMVRMKKDMESEAVEKAIAADVAEAQKFGIAGTPGFVINGVSLRGAYPAESFKKIIDRQLAAN